MILHKFLLPLSFLVFRTVKTENRLILFIFQCPYLFIVPQLIQNHHHLEVSNFIPISDPAFRFVFIQDLYRRK